MQGQGPFIHWAENESVNEGNEKMVGQNVLIVMKIICVRFKQSETLIYM